MARVVSQPTLIVVITGNLSPSVYRLFPALKQNFGGHKYRYDDSMKRVVALWLTTEDDTRHVLPSTGSRISRPSYTVTKCVFIRLPLTRFTDEAYIYIYALAIPVAIATCLIFTFL